jgi:pimeloyl-ACP methyl ester carboxylesterase
VSTPTSVELPEGVRRITILTGRGRFAALEARPASGVCEREAALLVPGYTGSKEDFLAILDQLADGRRRVVAIDMRGQFETEGTQDPDGYSAAALAEDLAAIIRATGAGHLLGHSYGGLIAREALLADTGLADTGLADTGLAGTGLDGHGIASLTLMSSGPAALGGPRAGEVRAMLAALGVHDGSMPAAATLRAGLAELWREYLEPQAITAGVADPIVAFLRKRMLSNDPSGLVLMARHLLTAPDRTPELARLAGVPVLVIYGENDNAWSPAAQEDMARRLGASRV